MSHKLIDNDYTGFTAADADELTAIPFGYLFLGQEKITSFLIGNTGTDYRVYQVTVSGENTALNNAVTFSTDGTTWLATVDTDPVAPNGISDLVHCKFVVPDDSFTTSGTFIIDVDEEIV